MRNYLSRFLYPTAQDNAYRQQQAGISQAQWEREIALKELIQQSSLTQAEKDYALKYLNVGTTANTLPVDNSGGNVVNYSNESSVGSDGSKMMTFTPQKFFASPPLTTFSPVYINANNSKIQVDRCVTINGERYISMDELSKAMGKEFICRTTDEPGVWAQLWVEDLGWRNVLKEYDENRTGMPFIYLENTFYRLDNALKMFGVTSFETSHSLFDFLEVLGEKESGNDYTIVNKYGYMGKYQFGSIALRDIGFYDNNNNWTAKAKEYGVTSKETFLNNSEAQEAAMRMLLENNWGYLTNYGLLKYIGTKMNNIEITESGLLAAAHLVGIGGLKKALEANDLTSKKDGNGVSALEYMIKFGGYSVDEIYNK